MEHTFKTIYGYCPHLEKEYYITADYTKIPVLGQKTPKSRYNTYSCKYEDECPYYYNDCPLKPITRK